MISQLIKAKRSYLKTNNKTLLDKTPFQEFIIDCLGHTIDPKREYRLEIEKKKKRRGPLLYSYEPNRDGHPRSPPIIFSEKSGRQINYPKNKKLK